MIKKQILGLCSFVSFNVWASSDNSSIDLREISNPNDRMVVIRESTQYNTPPIKPDIIAVLEGKSQSDSSEDLVIDLKDEDLILNDREVERRKYGDVITKGILGRLGLQPNLLGPCEDMHKRLYQSATTDEQAILFGQAIMENKSLLPVLSRVIVPKFWKIVNVASCVGKYTLTVLSPFLSGVYAYLENEPGKEELIKALNMSSLIAFQFGAYAVENIYNYSSTLSTFYSNVLLEKRLLNATTNYIMDYEEQCRLPIAQQPDPQIENQPEKQLITQEYFDVFGKIGTELARNILKESGNNSAEPRGKLFVGAQETTSLSGIYLKSNICYYCAGLCRAASGLCGMANTVLAALSISYGPTEKDQTNYYVVPQILTAASSIALSEAAKLFEKGAGYYSRKLIAYPIYNRNLLSEVKEKVIANSEISLEEEKNN